MHELSIALSLIEVAQEALEKEGGGQVHALHLRIGALSGVEPQPLQQAFELASENTPFAQAKLVIRPIFPRIWCRACGQPRAAESATNLRCVVCGSPSSQLVEGQEIELFALEITPGESMVSGAAAH